MQMKIGKLFGLIEIKDGIMFYIDLENKKIRKVIKDLYEKIGINIELYLMGMCISFSGYILVCVV